jgi:hypothetical protein
VPKRLLRLLPVFSCGFWLLLWLLSCSFPFFIGRYYEKPKRQRQGAIPCLLGWFKQFLPSCNAFLFELHQVVERLRAKERERVLPLFEFFALHVGSVFHHHP